ncbi:hypothetical protein SK571_37650 [Lentzea sp. BCCO 10_0798]|uniref:DUF3558 domain-containing protein n=1 Tax=Lentzea kristufekii TaxID=3095430 RepID=A0ABU4U3I1_9PSEU|nr:hypothetical protein [Lentzea sp. BCCO 10_0798]MDX8055130.1 hypothetical protein [Lentzea sp. BCCO 10_0798]
MKRVLPLLLLLAGCAATPVAAPPSTTTTTTTETTVATTSPRIDTPHKLPAGPCLLLAAADFETPLATAPEPFPDLPRSCTFREGTGADSDLFVIVQFADAYAKPENAHETLLKGHTMAVSFASGPGIEEGTYLVAVNAAESFRIILSLRNSNSSQVAMIAQGKVQQAFARLVTS